MPKTRFDYLSAYEARLHCEQANEEIDRLRARVAELEAYVRDMETCLRDILDDAMTRAEDKERLRAALRGGKGEK